MTRAKPKLTEYLPDWAKCCQAHIDKIQELGECEVDLTDTNTEEDVFCPYCDFPAPTHRVVRVLTGPGKGYYVTLDWLDLDEGC